MGRSPRILIAAGIGLALADASVVTLGLPQILVELDTTVEGAAAVLAAYTLVLAAALLPAEWLRRSLGSARLGIAAFVLFAAAGAACAAADGLAALVVLRVLQALGAAGALVCGFDLLTRGEEARQRLWTMAAIIGTAAGPALGGVLTELFDWRAIFIVQGPIGLAAAVGCALSAREVAVDRAERSQPRVRVWDLERGPVIALACASAALSGVLFLLVLLLISGWSLSPLAAAAIVSVIAIAAFCGERIAGDQRSRAFCGCVLLAAGLLPLAFLTSATVAWTVAPMILAGLGMGLVLSSLVGHLLPEKTAADTALLLAVRHAGITLALVLIAPITAGQLDQVIDETRERGAALVLDAQLGPLDKLDLADAITAELDPVDPRDTLRRSLAAAAAQEEDLDDLEAYDELRRRADETLVRGVDDAFAPAFLISAALALIGALAVLPLGAPTATRTALVAAVAALALAGAQALVTTATGPDRVEIADPCRDRDLPSTGGIEGVAQDAGLIALDRAACNFGSSREELAIALADDEANDAYEEEYGVNPQSIGGIARGIIGF